MHIRRAAAASVLLTTLGIAAYAAPRTGDHFPTVSAEDLTGQAHSTDELRGRRALVVAITDKDAAGAAHSWFIAADAQVPANVARESLVSLHLPFFVSTSTAQSKAREQVPRQHWQATLLDRGEMARQLGLEGGQVPYVFVLDENGRVIAAVHAAVDSPQAETIWNAFGER
jgi:hypothetical protein